MSLLEVSNLSHAYGDKILYKDASFTLCKGEHMGLVGRNGSGKSTLIGMLTGEIIPDGGKISWQPGITAGYLDQYAQTDGAYKIMEYLKTAFAPLYRLEKRVEALYSRYAKSGEQADLEEAARGQEELEARDFYTIDLRVDQVARGLGLTALGSDRRLDQLSGGQRAKVILAKLLLARPDVLLLDEPTNFLDSAQADWLADYLGSFPGAFAVASHDEVFLERSCTCICDLEDGEMHKYHGTYCDCQRQKAHRQQERSRRYQAQQRMIRRTEEYIRKNIAGQNSKNAKGRRKQLERLERIAAPSFAAKPNIRIRELPFAGREALLVEGLKVGYVGPILPALNFSVGWGEKLVLTGFNGIGKSTLLKTLVGELPELEGGYRFSLQARIGYYEQELRWPQPKATPLEIIRLSYPQMTDREICGALSDCGVKKDSIRQAVFTLSGGEQSKVKLCRLLLSPWNFLILDEPTNHLDKDTKEQLQRALNRFGGSVLLVSHEAPFYAGWADRVTGIE